MADAHQPGSAGPDGDQPDRDEVDREERDRDELDRGVTDDELLGVLASLLDETEAVPDELTKAARAALTWRTVDVELAELLYDSAVDPDPVLVRDTAVARLFAFAGGELSVDVELQGDQLVGALSPPRECAIELQQPPTIRRAHSDEAGMFRLSDVQHGPTRLVVRDTDGAEVVATAWVVL